MQKLKFYSTKEIVSVSVVWTAYWALRSSKDVSDHPQTPGIPNMC